MSYIPLISSPYIKKEDVRAAVDHQRKVAASTMFIIAGVLGFTQLVIGSRLQALYRDLGQPIPAITSNSPLISYLIVGLFLIIGLKLLTSKPDYSKIDQAASKYRDGEMIKAGEILDQRFAVVFFMLGLLVAFLVITMILPIYDLTSQY